MAPLSGLIVHIMSLGTDKTARKEACKIVIEARSKQRLVKEEHSKEVSFNHTHFSAMLCYYSG